MKIVFCGPPHSGKSVFITNLIDKLPTNDYTIIRACPDGEGTWSNNKKQKETAMVRKKGKFTKTFIDDACRAIDNQTNTIVLVDVGGVMSKENEQVFKHCDSFVIISSDKEMKTQWLEFGQNLGLKCIGSLDSSLEGEEEIYSRTPYIQGRIVGLERGEILEDSTIISGIVSDIIDKSKYTGKTSNVNQGFAGVTIDDTELGFKLGYGKEIPTEKGIPIRKVRWNENAIPQIYREIRQHVSANQPVRINGVRANFIVSAICRACNQQGATDIGVYDIRLKQYIPIRKFPQKRGLKENEGLRFNIIENKENIFMDVDIKGEQYTLDDYSRCLLPKINERKNLYLSGRMPLWLLSSISNSYDSRRVFTFQPGKGFTCVSSVDEKDLGTIVDGIDGIDINRYFEEKRESALIKSPAIFQRNRVLYGIRNVLDKINGVRRNAKYVNPQIKSNALSTSENGLTDGVATDLRGERESEAQEPIVSFPSNGRLSIIQNQIEIGG